MSASRVQGDSWPRARAIPTPARDEHRVQAIGCCYGLPVLVWEWVSRRPTKHFRALRLLLPTERQCQWLGHRQQTHLRTPSFEPIRRAAQALPRQGHFRHDTSGPAYLCTWSSTQRRAFDLVSTLLASRRFDVTGLLAQHHSKSQQSSCGSTLDTCARGRGDELKFIHIAGRGPARKSAPSPSVVLLRGRP